MIATKKTQLGHILILAITFAGNVSSQEPQKLSNRDCYRPDLPDRAYYTTDIEYNGAVAEYYNQASFYLECINGYISESRKYYFDLYQQEAKAYKDEYDEVFTELQKFSLNRGQQ